MGKVYNCNTTGSDRNSNHYTNWKGFLAEDLSNAVPPHVTAQLQETCRTGGNVLIATDTGGRVLEITHMLEQMWSTRESGLSAYSLCILSNTGYHVIHFAKQMVSTDIVNPLYFRSVRGKPQLNLPHIQNVWMHIHMCSNVTHAHLYMAYFTRIYIL